MKALVEAAVAILVVWYFITQQQNSAASAYAIPNPIVNGQPTCPPFYEDPSGTQWVEDYQCPGGPGAGSGVNGSGSIAGAGGCGCGPCGGGPSCGCGGGPAPAPGSTYTRPTFVVSPGGTQPPGTPNQGSSFGSPPPPPTNAAPTAQYANSYYGYCNSPSCVGGGLLQVG